MGETPGSPTISMKLQRIAQQAQRYPEMVFNNVCHLIDQDFLLEAYRLTRKNSAPGVDQVTATQYAEHLDDTLRDLREQCRTLHINWIVDADVSGFFDNLDWSHLREFLQQRVSDGGILRLIGKWLHAGVLEAGKMIHPDKGAPPGGGLSPMPAKVFLPHVLGEW